MRPETDSNSSTVRPTTLEGQHIQTLLPNFTERSLTPAEIRRVATLERRAPRIVTKAKSVGVGIEPLGISGLFDEPRVYAGDTSDWVLGPADQHETFTVPRAQRQELERLLEAGLRFPCIYIAHEVPKGTLPAADVEAGIRVAEITRAEASRMVPDVPPPPDSLEVGERLSERSRQVLHALGRALPVVGAIAISPFVLVGAAIGALATLDPIVIGAIPAISTRPGDPAAWYVLARWEW